MVSEINVNLEGGITAFSGGNTANHLENWEFLTSDKEILETISGLPIDHKDLDTNKPPKIPPLSEKQNAIIDGEIIKLLNKKVIAFTEVEPNDYISPIFLKEKTDGGHRMILNLKNLNKKSEKVHFKMDTINVVTKLIKMGSFFTKIDIKDAYFSIKVLPENTKFLKFKHRNVLYKFLVLPNGYLHGPRKFTKVMKVPLATLRRKGVNILAYLDDCIIIADDFQTCFEHTLLTIQMFQSLGFTVHPQPKSSLTPSNCIDFLGFTLNSLSMSITLTSTKTNGLIYTCNDALNQNTLTIRQLASLLGKITSCFPASKHGRLAYRGVERLKTAALKANCFNFEATVTLNEDAKNDIWWWLTNAHYLSNDIWLPPPSLTIKSDACSLGWGGVLGDLPTGGIFSEQECDDHINVKELKAALFCLQSLTKGVYNTHIKILSDNSTTVASINKFGTSRSETCDRVAQEIWAWAVDHNNYLTCAHIPGIQNDEADAESRRLEIHTEWKLKPSIFTYVCKNLFFQPDIDLFASRLNTQLPTYISYRPDPHCIAVNAFTEFWGNLNFYAFPPFAIIPQVLQKILQEEALGILVVPDWPTQPWFIRLMEMTVTSVILYPRQDLLILPSDAELTHPLAETLHLRCCLTDGALYH